MGSTGLLKKGCDGIDADLWLYFNGGIETYERYEALSKMKKKVV